MNSVIVVWIPVTSVLRSRQDGRTLRRHRPHRRRSWSRAGFSAGIGAGVAEWSEIGWSGYEVRCSGTDCADLRTEDSAHDGAGRGGHPRAADDGSDRDQDGLRLLAWSGRRPRPHPGVMRYETGAASMATALPTGRADRSRRRDPSAPLRRGSSREASRGPAHLPRRCGRERCQGGLGHGCSWAGMRRPASSARRRLSSPASDGGPTAGATRWAAAEGTLRARASSGAEPGGACPRPSGRASGRSLPCRLPGRTRRAGSDSRATGASHVSLPRRANRGSGRRPCRRPSTARFTLPVGVRSPRLSTVAPATSGARNDGGVDDEIFR